MTSQNSLRHIGNTNGSQAKHTTQCKHKPHKTDSHAIGSATACQAPSSGNGCTTNKAESYNVQNTTTNPQC